MNRSAAGAAGPGADLRQALDAMPQVALGHWPTPLEPLPRLSAHLGGPPIWVKRDDCTGLGLGGNKVRKLEFLLGEARAAGATTIITVGGVQSNHARQTAAACARLGLRCELVLSRMVARHDAAYETGGNVLLDGLFGAEVRIFDDMQSAAERVLEALAEAEKRGECATFFPGGGSTATGAMGYVRAAIELEQQWGAADSAGSGIAGSRPQRILLSSSTGGTLAGLVLGLHALRAAVPVTAIAVYGTAVATSAAVAGLVAEAAAKLDIKTPSPTAIDVRDGFLGSGYGKPTDAMREALSTCARLEGLVLDPVYSGKGMAGLFAAVRSGELSGDAPVIFLHTGGSPALFV